MTKRYGVMMIAVIAMVFFTGQAWSETRQITDQAGNTVLVETSFQRIISLYAAHTENLFSLGLDREIIGVSSSEVFPPKALSKKVFSYHDGVEKYMAAQPDLVLVRPMIAQGYPDFVKALQRTGITVISLQPRSIKDTYDYWQTLGILTGREKQASAMIHTFEADLERVRSLVNPIPETQRKRVYFEAIHSRMRTFSPASIAMFALSSAGGINVADDAVVRHGTNIADYGKEHILSKADAIDVFMAQKGTMNHPTLRQIREEAGFNTIRAVKAGRIFIIDEKIVSRPTLRLLDGIHEIGRFLYPEVFNDVGDLKKAPMITRSQFAQVFCKMLNLPLKTPEDQKALLKRDKALHRYGDFTDVEYAGEDYKFIETAVSRGVFPGVSKSRFFPERPVKKSTIAYALFVHFDLPEVTKQIAIRDVDKTHPFFEQIRTAAGLGIITLTKDGKFRPDEPVSGAEVIKIIERAKESR